LNTKRKTVEGEPSISHVRMLRRMMEAPQKWHETSALAETGGVETCTSSRYLRRMVRLGVVCVARLFPEYLYRINPAPPDEAGEYLSRWEEARQVFEQIEPSL
jgi:hypothetical protein